MQESLRLSLVFMPSSAGDWFDQNFLHIGRTFPAGLYPPFTLYQKLHQ